MRSKRFRGLAMGAGFAALSLSILLFGCSSPPPGMVHVPKGEFTMGSNLVDTEAKALQYGSRKPWYANERPARKVTLGDFYIDKTEVTNKEYKEFVDTQKRRPPLNWGSDTYPPNLADHPVVRMTWADARDYCKWRKKRLPTEAEWEKAARGTDGREFPWGNVFDEKKVNTLGIYGGSTPVGTFKEGATPYGALDMSGNVQEWTDDWYKPYPDNDYKDEDYGEKFKVVRGGGWGGVGHYNLQVYVRTAYRNIAPPEGAFDDVGIRCVWSR